MITCRICRECPSKAELFCRSTGRIPRVDGTVREQPFENVVVAPDFPHPSLEFGRHGFTGPALFGRSTDSTATRDVDWPMSLRCGGTYRLLERYEQYGVGGI